MIRKTSLIFTPRRWDPHSGVFSTETTISSEWRPRHFLIVRRWNRYPQNSWRNSALKPHRTEQSRSLDMIRQIMLGTGYAIAQQGVRISRNRVFSTGTRYRMPAEPGKTERQCRLLGSSAKNG